MVESGHGASIAAPAQWRKWRRAVISIAAPARSTAARTSASRSEPPGWTIAVTPASMSSDLRAVGEREERVRGGDGAPGAVGCVETLRLLDGLAAGVDAADLARAEPDQLAVADEHDRVRHDAANEPPGEVEVGAPRGRSAPREVRVDPLGRVVGEVVGRADEHGAAGGADGAEVVDADRAVGPGGSPACR